MTPWDDSEFLTPGEPLTLPSPQWGRGDVGKRMDLLTVLMHEFGHVLGNDHDEDGVMAETLALGVRSSPVPDWSSFDGALIEWLPAKKK